jgi:hypothetical protein
MNKIPFVFFVVSLVVVASVTASPARTVGVNTGDWIKFADIDVTWSSNDPNASKVWYGMDLEMYNQTEWVRAEITQVSGTNVTIQSVEHFKNGTDEVSGGWVDVETGEGVNATSMVIGANLNEGDPIYTAGDYSNWFINETITRVYPGSTRETNHINITYAFNYTIPPDIDVDYFYSMNFYWDKATGIIVEDSFEVINQTGEYLTAWSMDLKITESNVWVIPEFPTVLAWLAIGTATIVVILGKRKLLRLSRDRPVISK